MPINSRNDNVDGLSYYYVKGSKIALESEPDVYAVRLKPAAKLDSPLFSPSSRRLLDEESEPAAFIANYGLRIMRSTVPRTADDQRIAIRRLDGEAGVDEAASAFKRTAGNPELMFVTRRFIVQFRPDVEHAQIEAFNSRRNVRIVERTAYMPNGFVLEAPAGEGPTGPVGLANEYFESGLTLSATPDFVRQVHTRQKTVSRSAVPRQSTADSASRPEAKNAETTPRGGEYLAHQWHLNIARVLEAWDVTIGDPSIVVAVLDDGIDVGHPEFAGKVVGESDFASHISDARPKSQNDKHGTACAGVAVALGVKAHGSAPGASLLAVRTPEFLGVADEAEMFRWVCDQGADVISCSWGPADGTGSNDPLPDNVRAAIHYCISEGREGKGIPILWAAGNGNESVSLDGYASNPDVMAIAASTSKEVRSHYSDFGPEIWVCAPSSGSIANGDKRIFTTDRTGNVGYNPADISKGDEAGDYTNDFGGTSSATPLVAGVVALMLSVNSNLTHQQVREVLSTTAARIGDATMYDGSGHSPHHGFGRVDARKAVDSASSIGMEAPSVPSDRPRITGPVRMSRSDSPPVFVIGTGANPLYAIEVATQWRLFDGTHDGERNPDNFYASWESEPLLSDTQYELLLEVWQRLRGADRLYYRVHSAQDASWAGWAVSTQNDEAASAPSIEISAGVITTVEPTRTSMPTVTGPSSFIRGDSAPLFQVNTAGKAFYAFEVAARPELFNSANEIERTSATHWGSWQDFGMLSASSFQVPAPRWAELQGVNRLYYRIHVADDEEWNGWGVSTADEQSETAPSITILDGIDEHNNNVVYPSSTFEVASNPDDGIDYSDPVTGGSVPLIEVRSRLEENLSANFVVRELAARQTDSRGTFAAYARISPQLVEGLQKMRETLGKPIAVNSCYRYPALNDDVDGAGQSQHLAGRAADIRSTGVEPLALARLALESMGSKIGLGLGRNTIHVDIRGETTSWVYDGAAMSEPDFDAWVRQVTTELGRDTTSRLEMFERTRPSILGPSTSTTGAEPPQFTILPGNYPFYGVELASDWTAFKEAPGVVGLGIGPEFASWRANGLISTGNGEFTSYSIPEEDWSRLSGSVRWYYRAVFSGSRDFQDIALSIDLTRAEEAPSLLVNVNRSDKSDTSETVIDHAVTRRADEGRWRGESTKM